MANSGFAEENAASYEAPQHLVGQWRRFGKYGVAYEIQKLENETEATIKVFGTGEVLTHPITEILEDPIVECLP